MYAGMLYDAVTTPYRCRNPPANLTPSAIQPTFEVVRQSDAHYVLVLDTSGSMSVGGIVTGSNMPHITPVNFDAL